MDRRPGGVSLDIIRGRPERHLGDGRSVAGRPVLRPPAGTVGQAPAQKRLFRMRQPSTLDAWHRRMEISSPSHATSLSRRGGGVLPWGGVRTWCPALGWCANDDRPGVRRVATRISSSVIFPVFSLVRVEEVIERPHPSVVVSLALERVVHPRAEALPLSAHHQCGTSSRQGLRRHRRRQRALFVIRSCCSATTRGTRQVGTP